MITIQRVGRTVCFPSRDRFVELGVASVSAAVPELQSMDASERAALIETARSDMAAPLEAYVRNAEAVSPMETHIVVAHKRGPE